MEWLQQFLQALNQFGNAIWSSFQLHHEVIYVFCRVSTMIALFASCVVGAFIVLLLPIRIRFGIVRLDPLLKLIIIVGVLGWMGAAMWASLFFPFLIVAKLWIIHVMIAVGLGCWVLLIAGPQLNLALTSIQKECEIATNLTFLQADYTRAQLESLNERIRRSVEPEERDATEMMLRSISPIVSLFLKKERSVIKWSFAAVDVGKTLMKYFWSDEK